MLDFEATKYASNYHITFTNFRPVKYIAHTAIRKAILSYRQSDIVKTMTYGKVKFQEVSYISTFVYNLYSKDWLYS